MRLKANRVQVINICIGLELSVALAPRRFLSVGCYRSLGMTTQAHLVINKTELISKRYV